MCLMAANTFLIWIHEGATKEELVERIVTLCVTMNLQKEHICKGIAEAHAVSYFVSAKISLCVHN